MSQTTLPISVIDPESNPPDQTSQPQDLRTVANIDYEIAEGSFKHATPLEVFVPLAKAVGGFDLDPCACDDSQLARKNIRNEGGLKEDWGQYAKIFCNHPYNNGQSEKWHRKAIESDADLVVMLSRGSFSSDWFQNVTFENADLICLLDKKITFIGYDHQSFFPPLISVYGDYPTDLKDHLSDVGVIIPNPGDVQKQAEAKNEIVVEQPQQNHDPVLPFVSKGDNVIVEFEQPVNIDGEFYPSINFSPLTRQYVHKPSPVEQTTRTKNVEPSYLEISGAHRHKDGSDTFITLYQSVTNHREVACYVYTDMGWIEQQVRTVRSNNDFDQSKPTTAMNVPNNEAIVDVRVESSHEKYPCTKVQKHELK